MITAYATIETAVEAMRCGAWDYLSKPFTPAPNGSYQHGDRLSLRHCLGIDALRMPSNARRPACLISSTPNAATARPKLATAKRWPPTSWPVLLGIAGASGNAGHGSDAGAIAFMLVREVAGSFVLGLGLGWLTILMLRSVDNYQVEILLTLALAMGLYSLATALHTSGPLAVVVAGLIIGGKGRARAMSARTAEHLDMFWEIVDEVLNVVLFVLIGFEFLVVPFSGALLLLGLVVAALVLVGRYLSVGATVLALGRQRRFQPHAVKILTWGGLRGGLSLAMALSLGPSIAGRHTILAVTYLVVVFSIAVQGLSFGRLIRATSAP